MDLKKLTYAELTVIREDLAHLVGHELQKNCASASFDSPEVQYWESRLKKVREEMTKRLKSINLVEK